MTYCSVVFFSEPLKICFPLFFNTSCPVFLLSSFRIALCHLLAPAAVPTLFRCLCMTIPQTAAAISAVYLYTLLSKVHSKSAKL